MAFSAVQYIMFVYSKLSIKKSVSFWFDNLFVNYNRSFYRGNSYLRPCYCDVNLKREELLFYIVMGIMIKFVLVPIIEIKIFITLGDPEMFIEANPIIRPVHIVPE
ncbi:hypothetical protein OSTOST_13494 [Ostertagia ostertagi]